MKKCTSCGAEISGLTKFCENCGAPVSEAIDIEQAQPIAEPVAEPVQEVKPEMTTTEEIKTDNTYSSSEEGQTTYFQDDNQYVTDAEPGSGKATASLICGIIGLLCFGPVLGIISICLSISAKNEGNTSGVATAGLVLGIIDIIGAIISLLLVIIPNLN